MPGVVGMDAVSAVVRRLQAKTSARQRSKGVNDLAGSVVRRNPGFEGPFIGIVVRCWVTMFYLHAGRQQLRNQIRVLGLPLVGWITKSEVIAADLHNGGARFVREYLRQNAYGVACGIIRARIIANGLGEIALDH